MKDFTSLIVSVLFCVVMWTVGCIALKPPVDPLPLMPAAEVQAMLAQFAAKKLPASELMPMVGEEMVSVEMASQVIVSPKIGHVFACDVEASPMADLYGFFAMAPSVDATWTEAVRFPYDGQTHSFTNFSDGVQNCFVRVGFRWPK